MISRKLFLCGGAGYFLSLCGCGSKPEPPHTIALLDNTAEFVASSGAHAAWADCLQRVRDEVPQMESGGEITVYTMADTDSFAPRSRVEWIKDVENGKLIASARLRKHHTQQMEAELDTLLASMRSYPVHKETRLIESIYEILRNQRDRTSPSSGKFFAIASDMEPYTSTLTASHITISYAAVDHHLKELAATYPLLGKNAGRVQIIYNPSKDILKNPPVYIDRLRTFWLGFFQQIGYEAEWVSPKPDVATSSIGPTP